MAGKCVIIEVPRQKLFIRGLLYAVVPDTSALNYLMVILDKIRTLNTFMFILYKCTSLYQIGRSNGTLNE